MSRFQQGFASDRSSCKHWQDYLTVNKRYYTRIGTILK